jgi:hypothetical protein
MFAEAGALPIQRRERRPVRMIATARRGDGSVVELTIVDFSHDGCGVLCGTELKTGETLDLGVLQRGSAEAVVRWSTDGKAGLSFTSQHHSDSGVVPRGYERVKVHGEVSLRRAGKLHFRVRIYDLCPNGCKAEFIDRPEIGEQVWIKFDGMEAMEAHVCWIVGSKAGIKFARPIYAAVFDMLLVRLDKRP